MNIPLKRVLRRTSQAWRVAAVVASLLLCPSMGLAHRPSDSYVVLDQSGKDASFAGHWDLALRDLDYALQLDDGDGLLTWGEVRQHESPLRSMLMDSLSLSTESGACPLTLAPNVRCSATA